MHRDENVLGPSESYILCGFLNKCDVINSFSGLERFVMIMIPQADTLAWKHL